MYEVVVYVYDVMRVHGSFATLYGEPIGPACHSNKMFLSSVSIDADETEDGAWEKAKKFADAMMMDGMFEHDHDIYTIFSVAKITVREITNEN